MHLPLSIHRHPKCTYGGKISYRERNLKKIKKNTAIDVLTKTYPQVIRLLYHSNLMSRSLYTFFDQPSNKDPTYSKLELLKYL
jgi:hypothetical protein